MLWRDHELDALLTQTPARVILAGVLAAEQIDVLVRPLGRSFRGAPDFEEVVESRTG